MQPTEKPIVITTKAILAQFPKGHMLAAGVLAVCLGVWATTSPSKPAPALETIVIDADSSALTQTQEPLLGDIAAASEEEADNLVVSSAIENDWVELESNPSESAAAEAESAWVEKSFTVRSGDNLSMIFQRAGLSDRDLYELTGRNAEAKKLTRIMPGHEIVFLIDEDNKLQQLSHIVTRLNSTHFVREDNTFVTRAEARQPEIETAYKEATITSSLFLAGQAVGLHDGLIMQLANIFGWDIDFALDIRRGDKFSLLFEEKFLDGEKIGTGAILAAEFTNQGRKYRAVRYTNSHNESHYYTPEGESMRKAFLQAPLDFRRISSNFNPQRLHPIYKTVRPHRGTDYAADRGTPVWASGDGRIINSGYTNANGNYIVIQHGNNIQTKYLHLDRRHVKVGDRVRQRQVIGTVGSTGYSTAPHLHYEFLVDGVHRNPRTIIQKLPKAESVPKQELARFKEYTQPVVAQLEEHYHARRLALGDSEQNVN